MSVHEDKNIGMTSADRKTEQGQTHGVRAAYYSNLPGPNQTAWIDCICGEEITGHTPSWEDVGREMDEHLKEVAR